MEILLQCAENSNKLLVTNRTIKDLRIFAVYDRKFIANTNSFRHYVTVIGYSGGSCQVECSYVFHGSELSNSRISFAPSVYPIYWEQEYHNDSMVEVSIDIDEIDTEVFNEFEVAISQYLEFSADDGCYLINLENEKNTAIPFYASPKFPIKLLEQLHVVYWPFSISW